jgi:hypothetical protein
VPRPSITSAIPYSPVAAQQLRTGCPVAMPQRPSGPQPRPAVPQAQPSPAPPRPARGPAHLEGILPKARALQHEREGVLDQVEGGEGPGGLPPLVQQLADLGPRRARAWGFLATEALALSRRIKGRPWERAASGLFWCTSGCRRNERREVAACGAVARTSDWPQGANGHQAATRCVRQRRAQGPVARRCVPLHPPPLPALARARPPHTSAS